MKKLGKLKLNQFQDMTEAEMKNIFGGGFGYTGEPCGSNGTIHECYATHQPSFDLCKAAHPWPLRPGDCAEATSRFESCGTSPSDAASNLKKMLSPEYTSVTCNANLNWYGGYGGYN